ncbi:MAG TPA: AtpZ/AtpI family protein [Longimicrobiaceae bacterium]|nr:AtpZ/AtpI family protein [Longimicrobiaceae bacterium]
MAQRPGVPGGPRPPAVDAGEYAGAGFTFAGGILLFTFLGKWADDRLGTSPWLLMLGVFAGFAVSLAWIYRRLVVLPRQRDARRGAEEGE